MSPVEVNEKTDPVGTDVNPTSRRASRKGFLPISLSRYLELLDWTGRQIHRKKSGSIPDHLAPILERIGISASNWCDLVKRFGKLFKRAAGTAESIATEAVRRGLGYMHAPGAALISSTNGQHILTG